MTAARAQARRRLPQGAAGAHRTGSDVGTPSSATLADLATALDTAMDLLRQTAYMPRAPAPAEPGDEATLLQQCLALCEQQESVPQEPVRIVEHLACTGGTLISKCLGLMPNVQLLSEVDPLSPLSYTPDTARFAPTDVNLLVQQGTRGADPATLQALFQAEVRVLLEHSRRRAHHLVLRAHSHSHFCTGPAVPQRPSVRELIPADIPVRSIVTVRDPIDSYAALAERGWLQFTPGNFAEYCRRYVAFLDAHASWPVYKYEDFVSAPGPTLRAMCDALALGFNPEFERLLGLMQLTGDSGRSSDEIGPRPRRPSAQALWAESADLPEYKALAVRLGYTPR